MRKLLLIFSIGLLIFSCYPSQQFELDEPFRLEYGQTRTNNDEKLHIRFNDVVSDGRCPIEHNCLLPGNASVELTLRQGFQRDTFVLNTYDAPTSHTAFGYLVSLVALAPQRSITEPPEPGDYVVTLTISEFEGTCETNKDCDAEGSYCSKAQGDCEGMGQCEARPEICLAVEDPVCGCDGRTYGNACAAASFGVNVAYKGLCEQAYCWSNKECSEDEYCYFADCALETGKCQPRPEICTFIYDPVCGCDGQTYSNSCVAASQGMSVDHTGACRDTHCDDGTTPACRMVIPQCSEYEILAYQDNCYACVNPATCAPWGEPGCESDKECATGETCDMCGTSSCPMCEDCVAACVNK